MKKEQLIKELKSIDIETCNPGYICNLLVEANQEANRIINYIVTYEQLEDMIRHHLDEFGIYEVKRLINGIKDLSEDFYFINGYGNARNIDNYDLKYLKDEMINALENK